MRASRQYRLETVSRACAVLKAFRSEEEPLTLSELTARTGMEKTIAFRLVHTLHEEGLLRRASGRRYLPAYRLLDQTRFRIGFAAQTGASPFSTAVTDSVRWAAEKSNIDLVVLDNQYSAKVALRNARALISAKVNLAIEFQTHEKAAPIVSSLFGAEGIPLIAVEIPHPGATYFGVDNYRAGMLAGSALAKWCKQHWNSEVDEVLLLELGIAGTLPHLRLSGAEAVLRQFISAGGRFRYIETRGEFPKAQEAVRKHLKGNKRSRTLIVGVNDPAVLGALRAFEEAGQADRCAAVGMGATPDSCVELRRPGTRLIGSVAFFPERYGADLIRLAVDILQGKPAPPAVYAQHRLITAQNVEQYYPAAIARSGQGGEHS